MAWKLPFFTDTVLVLTSRWLQREMFCLPQNIVVLMIALGKFIFLSDISWFCVEILNSKVSNHEGGNTSFFECSSCPLTTILAKKLECEGDGLKWFLIFFIGLKK